MPSVSTNDNFVENAVYLTANVLGQKLWSVHRLDLPTSGCLILAKSGAASGAIQKQWSEARKCYSLVVQAEDVFENDQELANNQRPPVPIGSTITHWMDTSCRGAPKPISSFRSDSHDKECSLVLESWEPLPCDPVTRQARAFVKVRLLTGRTHQIRSQMGQIGWPLQDDIMYRKGFDVLECERQGIEFYDPPLSLRCYRMTFKYKEEDFTVELETGPHF
jgi:23S rRNA pseudouridine1911/1915/1917 synthase